MKVSVKEVPATGLSDTYALSGLSWNTDGVPAVRSDQWKDSEIVVVGM